MYCKTMIQTVSFTVTVVCCFCFVNMARSKVVIAPDAVVSKDAVLKGDINIGRGTVIGPKVRIIAVGGPIIIGDYIVIEEQVLISNAAPVCKECELKRKITIGKGTVIGAKAQIIAERGPMIIGEYIVIRNEALISNAVVIAPGAPVCKECELKGEITIGGWTVILPKARIIAEGGPIIIGQYNAINEQVLIKNTVGEKSAAMVIGANNVFEVGSHVESLKIGDYNVLQSNCYVGRHTELTSHIVVQTNCKLTCNEVIPEYKVTCGRVCDRRIQIEKPAPQTLQLEFLIKILPNYHHLQKPTRTETAK